MTRLIDADALRERICLGHFRSPCESPYSELNVVNILDSAPTIDAAPVRRGEWVTDDDDNDDWAEPYCKKCGCSIPCGPAHFCPNCGADMRKGAHYE